MQKVYLVCGVPGSGKTWVCRQLREKFEYVAHDNYMANAGWAVHRRASTSDKPVVTECPFAERPYREELERMGCDVIPIFIIESAETVKKRYEARENKPFPKGNYTRCLSILARANEWKAKHGTSSEILEYLQAVKF